MDLVRAELLPPILIRDLHREAQQHARVHLVASRCDRLGSALAARLGAAMVLAGWRIQTAGKRPAAAAPLVAPATCGCGA